MEWLVISEGFKDFLELFMLWLGKFVFFFVELSRSREMHPIAGGIHVLSL